MRIIINNFKVPVGWTIICQKAIPVSDLLGGLIPMAEWYEDQQNVLAFARWAVDELGYNAHSLLEYIEAPHKWTWEYHLFRAKEAGGPWNVECSNCGRKATLNDEIDWQDNGEAMICCGAIHRDDEATMCHTYPKLILEEKTE